ncbi:amino acid ABC transporter substrate-binding protein [Xanthobacter sp. TB0139]|uniref:amino acid ABC transporter substrate-binding protein n=1 Tax=Xanthobacter sp. TB0139 TaxID=3459178 RepID=UPI0040394221
MMTMLPKIGSALPTGLRAKLRGKRTAATLLLGPALAGFCALSAAFLASSPALAQGTAAQSAKPATERMPTLQRVKETGTFRIGHRHAAPPYSYVDKDGKVSGYMVDICREVARNVQSTLKMPQMDVQYIEVSAEDRLKAVRDGKVDILCEPTSMTMSRRTMVDFSLPTFLDGASVVTRDKPVQSLEDLQGRKVGVLKNTTTANTLRTTLQEMHLQADVTPVNSHPEGLRMLSEGKLDAYFADRGILNFLLTNSPYSDQLALADQYFTFETYALALPRGDTQFRTLVDGTLANLYRSERVHGILARTFGEFPPDQFLNALFIINGVPN